MFSKFLHDFPLRFVQMTVPVQIRFQGWDPNSKFKEKENEKDFHFLKLSLFMQGVNNCSKGVS